MNPNAKKICLALLGLVTSLQLVSAQTVLVSFYCKNSSSLNDCFTNSLQPDSGGRTWNVDLISSSSGAVEYQTNNGVTPGVIICPLVTTANAASGWTLAISNGYTGGGGQIQTANMTYGDYSGPYPSVCSSAPYHFDQTTNIVMKDGLRIPSKSGSGAYTFTIGSLNTSATYNVLTYSGCNGNYGGNQTTALSLYGGIAPSPLSFTFNSQNNSSTAPAWSNVTPDSNGRIQIAITTSGNNAMLNAIYISQNVPQTVSAANSTVTASPTTVAADGTTTSTITVTLLDTTSAAVPGKTVTLAQTSGSGTPTITTISGTTSASGQATFTVKSATPAADVFTATDTTDSVTVTQTATVTFAAGAVSAANSTVVASPTTVAADGTTTSTITVTLNDTSSNPVSGKTVTLAQTSGSGTPTITTTQGTTDGSGHATFTVASTTAAADVFTATDTTDTVTVTATATVTFTAGAVTAAQSTVTASPATVTSDGVGTSTITVTLKDVNSNPVSGKTVTLAQTSGAGTPTITTTQGTTDGSGHATFTVASTTPATDVFTATDTTDSVTVTQTATVTFALPSVLVSYYCSSSSFINSLAPDAGGRYWNVDLVNEPSGQSTLQSINGGTAANPVALVTTGNSPSGWTLAITNISGSYGGVLGANLTFNTYGGPFPSVCSNSPYRFDQTTNIVMESGMRMGSSGASFTFAGLNTGATYNVLTSCDVGGSYGGPQNNTLTMGTSADPASVAFNSSNNSTTAPAWSSVTPDSNGRIQITVTGAGAEVMSAIYIAQNSAQTVSAANSTVSASPTSVAADGTTTSTITVTLLDTTSAAVSGKTVTLAQTSGSGTPTISTTQGTTDGSGHATFTVKSTTAAADVFTATDTTDSVTVTQTATVTFTAAGPPSPVQITNSISGNMLNLTWPSGQGWRLVSQTNSLSGGLNETGTWTTVGGASDGSYSVTLDPTQPSVYYELVYP